MKITVEDFKALVNFDKHEQLVQVALDKISDQYLAGNALPLLKFFNDYTQFNGYFANGVTALTSLIGNQRDIFVDKTVALKTAADRSNYVASFIFDAARDEYHDRDATERTPHRSLAQAFMTRLVDLHPEIENINEKFELDENHYALDNNVFLGYTGRFYAADVDNDLQAFAGIGYHIGSEILADVEFTLIHRQLKFKIPALRENLKGHKIEIAGSIIDSYDWLKIHSGDGNAVEQEHFEMALMTAKKALEYTEVLYHYDYIKALKDGFCRFAEDHEAFFSAV